MPMIVPHQSQAGIATGNAGQAAPYRSASAFVTPGQSALPNGLNQLARGMDKLGDALAKYGLDRLKMQNAADLLADKIAYEDALRDFDSNYRQTHQGVSARDAEEAYAQFHQEQYQRLQEKWGGNPWLMQGVNRMVEGIRLPSMQRAVNYRDQQEDAYQKDLVASSEMHTLELYADPSRSVEEKEAAMREHENTLRMFAGQKPVMVDGKVQWQGGRNIDAQLMALRQKAAVSNIEGLLAGGDIAGAQRAVNMAGYSGLGSLAVAQESGGDPGNISRDTSGSKSYGLFQFNNMGGRGTANSFMSGLKDSHPQLYAALGGGKYAVGSAEFDKLFQEVARGPMRGEMVQAQQEHLGAAYMAPIESRLKGSEFFTSFGDTRAFKEVMLSTAIQHGPGGANRILREAWGMVDKNADKQTRLTQFIKATYQLRGRPGEFKTALSEQKDDAARQRFMSNMRGRYAQEEAQALDMVRAGGGEKAPGASQVEGNLRGTPTVPAKVLGAFQKQIDTLRKKQQVDDFLTNTLNMPAPERLAQLDAQYGNDPAKREVYDAIRQGIMHDANAKESMRNLERRDRKLASLKEMEQAANLAPEQSYQKMQEIGQRLPLDERADFYKAANNLRNPGYYDDPWAVQEITDRLANGEEVNIRAEYGSRLTPKTAKRFAEQAFRTALPGIRTAFDDVANEWLSEEKNKNHAKELGLASRTALWTRFLAQTDADEKKDYARLRQEAADFFKKVTLEKGWFNRDVETVQGLVGGVLDKYDDARPMQGTAEYGIVVDLLKNAGVKPDGFGGGYSDAQLSAGYRQYRDMQKGGKE